MVLIVSGVVLDRSLIMVWFSIIVKDLGRVCFGIKNNVFNFLILNYLCKDF